MKINYTGHKMDVTSALKNFVEDKLKKIDRHFEHITSINMVFNVEKLRHIAEATILISKGEVHASAESDDMYSAVDLLVDKLDKQLTKHKEKKLDHRDHRDRRDHPEEFSDE